MKKYFFSLLVMIMIPVLAKGQGVKAVFVEVMGQSHAEVIFDSRFQGDSGFGYSTGLSMGKLYSNRVTSPESHKYSPNIPIEINYLTKGKLHHFEAAAGMVFAYVNHEYYYSEEVRTLWGAVQDPSNIAYIPAHTEKDKGFGYGCYVSAGYRMQASNRLMLKAGLNLGFNLGGKTALSRCSNTPYVYLGAGWAF